MNEVWCKRLAVAVGVWAILALALQVVVSLAFR
jgi:hypothetical protein